MTMTTAPATAPAFDRTRWSATVGGALWLLLPAVWAASDLRDQDYGSLGFVSVAASYWACLVLAPALLATAAWRVRTALPCAGRAHRIGAVMAAAGLAAMALGNGIEVGSMTLGGAEVPLGHMLFLLGFLTSVVGGGVLGATLLRRGRDGLGRISGWLLVLALPLGIGIGYAASLLAPQDDTGFWAAISVPTGLAWLFLGGAMAAGQGSDRPLAP